MKPLVIITGASSGIGKALAQAFAKEEYPLLLLARNLEKMEAMKLANCICVSVDVTDYDAVKQAIQMAEKKYGKTDLLVNCAGVMLLGYPEQQSYSEWEQMIDVNIKGILTTTNVVLSDMIERNTGTIINISSIAGRKTFNNHSIYCGSKYAVHAISESIRKEVSQSNVRVSIVAPGVVSTPLLEKTTNQEIEDDYNVWKQSIEGGLDPQEVVDSVMFIYKKPQDVCIREIVLAKTKQED